MAKRSEECDSLKTLGLSNLTIKNANLPIDIDAEGEVILK
jgi:hypothetical protein